jgi:hypothetical protein
MNGKIIFGVNAVSANDAKGAEADVEGWLAERERGVELRAERGSRAKQPRSIERVDGLTLAHDQTSFAAGISGQFTRSMR